MRYGLSGPLCKLFAGTALLLALLAAPPAQASDELTIVALGDSLTAGYLLGPDEGFPEQLGRALAKAGHDDVKVVNAGVSGDTTSGGLARLDWAVGPGTDAVIVELGANDALRAIDPGVTRRNLDEIVARLKARGLPILLAGMYAPPNLGRDYGDEFNPIFAELAEREGLVFYPFFLEGVAADPALNLGDGIHPTAEGVAIIVESILPEVEKLIERARAKRSAAN